MSDTTSSTQRRYQISKKDLPLSCPMKGQQGWDAHPKVYLDFEGKGEVLCPYCGALYVLVDDES